MTAHDVWPPKCAECGRFIGYDELTPGSACPAHIEFTPDNHFGPEETIWTCWQCTAGDGAREPASNPIWEQ